MLSNKNVTVVGIGRVGLPLALFIANQNFKVTGIGRNKDKINELKQKKMPFIEEGDDLLKKYVNKNFFPTVSFASIKKSSVVILTLGTPIDENMNPVLDQINNVIKKIIPYLRKGQLIILRSTVSPNTTMYVKTIIEHDSKFKIGTDIFLAFCPERIAEGKSITEIREIPQIIGGVDIISTQKAKDFFENLGITCLTTDSTSAELAKLFTNMYRYISFAIANEFMVLAENFERNIHEIVELVNTGYKRNGLALPGLSAGPCLFKDGFFLINENPFIDLIAVSWKINEAVPLFLTNKLKEKTSLLGKRIVIFGLAFKPEIDDTRESLSFKLRKSFLHEHSIVLLHDPYVKKYVHQKIYRNYEKILENVDIIIFATKHDEYVRNKQKIISRVTNKTIICDIWNIYEQNKLIFRKDEIIAK